MPLLGGTTETGENLLLMTALIWKTPFAVNSIMASLTGPFSPLPSLYLKPFTASPLQKGLPVVALVPMGRA